MKAATIAGQRQANRGARDKKIKAKRNQREGQEIKRSGRRGIRYSPVGNVLELWRWRRVYDWIG